MKKKANILIISAILLILYYFVGHDFVLFYGGGKAEMFETATRINAQCNDNGACPPALVGWQSSWNGKQPLSKGNMMYYTAPLEGEAEKSHQSFRLIFHFAMPDHWFEVQGGVGREVTGGWQSR